MDIEYNQFNSCCRLNEIGCFGEPEDEICNIVGCKGEDADCNGLYHNLAELTKDTTATIKRYLPRLGGGAIATTIPSQTHAVAALRQLGFRRVAHLPGTSRQTITLWFKQVRRRN